MHSHIGHTLPVDPDPRRYEVCVKDDSALGSEIYALGHATFAEAKADARDWLDDEDLSVTIYDTETDELLFRMLT